MVSLLHSVFEVWAAVAVSGRGAGVGDMCREDIIHGLSSLRKGIGGQVLLKTL